MRKKLTILLLVLSIFTMTGCAPQEGEIVHTEDTVLIEEDISNTKRLINNADKITLKRAPFTFSNINFKVYADGSYAGRVKGKIFNLTGDVVNFYTAEGNILGSEKQMKRWGIKFNRMAEVRNENGNPTSYIGERVFNDMFKIRYSMHFFDQNRNEVAHTKKKVFSIFNNNNVYNNQGELTHKVKGRFSLFKKYTIEPTEANTMSNVDIIFFTVIQDAINKAKEK